MEETWKDIEGDPALRGVEVSTSGRVRRWSTLGGRALPRPYRGTPSGTTVHYRIGQRQYTIDELMRAAFGDEAGEAWAGYDPRDRDRDLTHYEIAEIMQAEGWKPAFEVAEDFLIDAVRVRQLWDGDEA